MGKKAAPSGSGQGLHGRHGVQFCRCGVSEPATFGAPLADSQTPPADSSKTPSTPPQTVSFASEPVLRPRTDAGPKKSSHNENKIPPPDGSRIVGYRLTRIRPWIHGQSGQPCLPGLPGKSGKPVERRCPCGCGCFGTHAFLHVERSGPACAAAQLPRPHSRRQTGQRGIVQVCRHRSGACRLAGHAGAGGALRLRVLCHRAASAELLRRVHHQAGLQSGTTVALGPSRAAFLYHAPVSRGPQFPVHGESSPARRAPRALCHLATR